MRVGITFWVVHHSGQKAVDPMSLESSLPGVREATANVQRLHLLLMAAWGGPRNPGHVPILRGLLGDIGIGKTMKDCVSAVEATLTRGAIPDAAALWCASLSLWSEMRTRSLPDDVVDEGMTLLALGSGVLYWCLLPHCGADFPHPPDRRADGWQYRWGTAPDGSAYLIPRPTVSRTGPVDPLGRLLELCERPSSESRDIEKLATGLREEMTVLTVAISKRF